VSDLSLKVFLQRQAPQMNLSANYPLSRPLGYVATRDLAPAQ
jgi:hypothetical protein